MPSAITNVDFFCSPLNPNGLFTMSFSSASARESYFSGIRISSMSITAGTYARKDGVLTVGVNESVLNASGVNYVRFQNPQFNNKWFYAFVRKIEYVNPNTSKLYIDTDVFMTYQFDITHPNEVFVERETIPVSEDVAGNNVLSEPVTMNTYLKTEKASLGYNIRTETEFTNNFMIGIIIGWLNKKSGEPASNATAKDILNNGGVKYIDGSPLGGGLLVVEYGSDFIDLIHCIAALAGTVIAAFPIPKHINGIPVTFSAPLNVTFEDEGAGTSHTFKVYTMPANADPVEYDISLLLPQNDSPWNYSPRNQKLFTYPYLFLVGSNHSGTESVFRYDNFRGQFVPYGIVAPEFSVRYNIASSPSLVMKPASYEGNNNVSNSVINNNMPTIPWDSNAYEQYIAQHANSLTFQQVRKTLDYAINLGQGLAKDDLGGMIKGSYDYAMAYEGKRAELQDLMGIGNDVHNVPSGSLIGCYNQLRVTIYQKFISEEDVQRIDRYFDRFGYRVDRIKSLSWNKRPDYDYIKTQGANVGGTIPADDKVKLNTLFDSGLTIWHNSSRYGLYADSGHTNR